jgi:hypothetical protein
MIKLGRMSSNTVAPAMASDERQQQQKASETTITEVSLMVLKKGNSRPFIRYK